MQIERISAALRPRNHWESVDLGFVMAQKWYLPLVILWFAAAIPVFILLHVLPFINVFWSVFILWWLKPLFEQSLLFYISRALFGEYPPIKQVLKQYWTISKVQLLPALLWRRFSLARSFNSPVNLLEGLNGKKRQERLHVLHFTHRNASQWLHIFVYLFEFILWLGFCFLLLAFIPEDSDWMDFGRLIGYEDITAGLISNLFYVIAMGLMAPFYVCGGFSLYLTRRTELEGWDIELNFRQIATRLKQLHSSVATALLALGLGLSFTLSPQTAEAISQNEATTLIEEVLAGEEFGKVETVKRWQAITEADEKEKEKEERNLEWFFELFKDFFEWFEQALPNIASLLEGLLWASVIVLILYLLNHFTNWLEWIGLPKFKTKKTKKPPTHLFGLEVNAESLPDDIPASVHALILAGKIREAIGLLYRASLIRLIHLHELEISDSATEGECRRLVRATRPDDESHYFSELTHAWLLLAYAHEAPDNKLVSSLCERWPQFYELHHE